MAKDGKGFLLMATLAAAVAGIFLATRKPAPKPPVAKFETSVTSGSVPLSVRFVDRSEGQIDSWVWDFGDGSISTERSPEHTFSLPGTYAVTLTVTGLGGSSSASLEIAVTEMPVPEAAFTVSVTSGPTPLRVAFTDLSTGTIDSWLWDFGDGETSTIQNPEHTFISPGVYKILLTVTGPAGISLASLTMTTSDVSVGSLTTIFYDPSEDDPAKLYVSEAATELKMNLEAVTGTTYTIETVPHSGLGILLAVNPNLPELLSKDDEAFKLVTDGNGVYITGKTPVAIRHGVYALLEKLGFRWFFMHPAWYVKPDVLSNIAVDEIQEPTFKYRTTWWYNPIEIDKQRWLTWKKVNRMLGPKKLETTPDYRIIVSDAELSVHPEWGCGNQIDVTNPEVVQEGISYARSFLANLDWLSVSIEPQDSVEWGTCPFAATRQGITNAVFNFTNEIARAIKDEFPARYVETLSYSTYSLLPDIWFENNVLVLVCTEFSDLPVQMRLEHFRGRGAKTGIYDYSGKHSRQMQPYIDNIRFLHSIGGIVYLDQGGSRWGEKGLLMYIMSKLTWDFTQGVDILVGDFCERAFGPAAIAMKRFFDRHDVESYENRRVLALAFKDLYEAEQLASGYPEVIERIRHLEYYLRWEWQNRFGEVYDTTTPEGEQAWRDFKYSLIPLNILWNWHTDFTSDCWNARPPNPQPPTEADARAWMDQALIAFSNEVPIEVPPFHLWGVDLIPLGDFTQPVLSPFSTFMRGDVLFRVDDAYLSGHDTLSVTITHPVADPSFYGVLAWYAPNAAAGSELKISLQGLSSPIGINLPLSIPGIYRLGFATHYCCKGEFKFEDIPVPASLVPAERRWAVNGYFYVPEHTRAFSVFMRVVWTTKAGRIILRDSTGSAVVDQAVVIPNGQSDEWIVLSPTPGLWKMEISHEGRTTLDIKGIPPLLWHDASYLLVPT